MHIYVYTDIGTYIHILKILVKINHNLWTKILKSILNEYMIFLN